MICIIPCKKILKKKKRIIPYRDFVIINCTTNPDMRDLPNIMGDIEDSGNGLSLSSIDALAYQMSESIFDEHIALKRRQSLVDTFFIKSDFMTETMTICAYQIKHPDVNVYVVIDDNAYEKYADRYIKAIEDLIEAPAGMGKLVFLWNDTLKMQEHLMKQLDKEIGSFDKDAWMKDRDEYSEFLVDDLEDDDYDKYLDNVGVRDIIENTESNREIRELFFRYGRYSKNQRKALGRFVKVAAEQSK